MVNPDVDELDTTISESMRIAQRDAEREAEILESEAPLVTVNNPEGAEDTLIRIPKLLQQVKASDSNTLQELVDTTQGLKAKGKQLDLLLFKAETYSHFIRQNQERTKEILESNALQYNEIPSKTKKRKSPVKGEGGKKKQKGDEAVSHESIQKGFQQPPNLVGGVLMNHQLEGLKWLISLWENGLSGILAGKLPLFSTNRFYCIYQTDRRNGTRENYSNNWISCSSSYAQYSWRLFNCWTTGYSTQLGE